MPAGAFSITVDFLHGTADGCIRVAAAHITIYQIPHDFAPNLVSEPELKQAGIYLLVNTPQQELFCRFFVCSRGKFRKPLHSHQIGIKLCEQRFNRHNYLKLMVRESPLRHKAGFSKLPSFLNSAGGRIELPERAMSLPNEEPPFAPVLAGLAG